MRGYLKYFSGLIFLTILIFLGAVLLQNFGILNVAVSDIFLICFSFALISVAVLVIFFIGRRKKDKEQAFYTLTSVSLKFIAELLAALLWFIAAKKTSAGCILLFFVLYLSFSLYSFIIIANTLRNR